MQLPKELNDLGKMKTAYIVQMMIAAIYSLLVFASIAASVYLSKSYVIEILLCVAVAGIMGSNASQLKKSFYIYQKLEEIQDQISNIKQT